MANDSKFSAPPGVAPRQKPQTITEDIMKIYYHRHWAESNKGGATMLLAEEYVYSASTLSDSRGLQDPDQPSTSGWDCHRYSLEWEDEPGNFSPDDIEGWDDNLPLVPATQQDKNIWEAAIS